MPLKGYEVFMEVLSFLGIITFTGLAIYHYRNLPDLISTHYSFTGEPDAWGIKKSLFWQISVAFVLYAGLTVVNRFPYVFNYPVEITKKNFKRQYRMARTLLSVIKLGMILIFLTIFFTSIKSAYGQPMQFMGGFMVLLVVGTLILPLVVYLIVAIQKDKKR